MTKDPESNAVPLEFHVGEEEEEALVLKCESSAPATVRRRVDSILSELSLSPLEAYEVKVAVGEAVGNAIRHGCKLDSGKYITVRIKRTPAALIFAVSDDGPGFCPDAHPCRDSDPDNCGGLGLRLMRHLMDEVEFDFDHGTTIRLTKRLRPNA